jgi:hypothetical protein
MNRQKKNVEKIDMLTHSRAETHHHHLFRWATVFKTLNKTNIDQNYRDRSKKKAVQKKNTIPFLEAEILCFNYDAATSLIVENSIKICLI